MPGLWKTALATRLPGRIGEAYRRRAEWERMSREMLDEFANRSKYDKYYITTPYLTNTDGFLNRKLNSEEFVEEAMGVMFAGSGTTSTTLTYLLYAISRPENLHIREKIREEVKISLDNMPAIRKLPYLNAIIKETFRVYPTIISSLPRVMDKTMSCEGHNLPQGTIVNMQNYVHHRDRTVFPEPDVFNPERWLHSSSDMESALTPFSVGKRGCIGQNLAWEELYIAVSTIISTLELRLGSEMTEADMEIEDRFNIAPKARKLMLKVLKI